MEPNVSVLLALPVRGEFARARLALSAIRRDLGQPKELRNRAGPARLRPRRAGVGSKSRQQLALGIASIERGLDE
jgi:hypothetical protein